MAKISTLMKRTTQILLVQATGWHSSGYLNLSLNITKSQQAQRVKIS